PPGRAQHHLELARALRGGVDRALDVELLLGALARERAELAERDLHLPHVERQIVAVALPRALLRELHRAAAAAPAAHPDARPRRSARVAEGRGAAGADPLVAPVVALLLLLQALLEHALERLEVVLLEHRPLFLG